MQVVDHVLSSQNILLFQHRAYRQHAIQVGVAARLHFAELLEGSKDVPSPILILGVPGDLMKHKKGLYSLWPQEVMGVLPCAQSAWAFVDGYDHDSSSNKRCERRDKPRCSAHLMSSSSHDAQQ